MTRRTGVRDASRPSSRCAAATLLGLLLLLAGGILVAAAVEASEAKDYRILKRELPGGWTIGAGRAAGSGSRVKLPAVYGSAGVRSKAAQVLFPPEGAQAMVGVSIEVFREPEQAWATVERGEDRFDDAGMATEWITFAGREVLHSHARQGSFTLKAYAVTGGPVLASVSGSNDRHVRKVLAILCRKLPQQTSRGLPEWLLIGGGLLAAGAGAGLLRKLRRPRAPPPAPELPRVPQEVEPPASRPPEPEAPGYDWEDPTEEQPEQPDPELPHAPDAPHAEWEGFDLEPEPEPPAATPPAEQPEHEEEQEREGPVVVNLTVRPVRVLADGDAQVRVTGQVLAESGAPVGDVKVRFDALDCGDQWLFEPEDGWSDEDGLVRTTWTYVDRAPPSQGIQLVADAVRHGQEPVSVRGTAHVRVTSAASGIEGEVRTPDGDAVADAAVELQSFDGSLKRTWESDADGMACFDDLEPGPYVLYASKEGFESADEGERARTKAMVRAGERASAALVLRPRRRLVESWLEHEQGLHDAMLRLLVGDRDGYLHNLAWGFGTFGAFLLEELLDPGIKGKFSRAGSFVVSELVDQAAAHAPETVALSGALPFADDVRRACDTLVDDLWPRVAAQTEIPDASGFVTDTVKAGLAALLQAKSTPEMEQVIRQGYEAALEDPEIREAAGEGGVRSLGTGMARPIVARAALYHAALIALPRAFLGTDLEALQRAHRDARAWWERKTDTDLLRAFGDEERFRSFERVLEDWTAFLADEAKRLRSYTQGDSGLTRIASMLADGVEDLLGGEDVYRSQRIGMPGSGHKFTYVNQLPLALRGFHYFMSAGDYWALLTVLSMGGAGAAGPIFDLGYKAGSFACLALGIPSLQKDVEGLKHVLRSASDATRDEGFARQFLELNAGVTA